MKTLLITLATVLLGIVALPTTAEAASSCSTGSSYTYYSGRASCGCASYTRRVIVGYDCHNHPTYRYYRVPVSHSCRHYSSHYGHSGHSIYHRGHSSHHSSHSSHHGSHHKGLTINGPLGKIRIHR